MANLNINPPSGFTAVYILLDGCYAHVQHSSSRYNYGWVVAKTVNKDQQAAIWYIKHDLLSSGTEIISSHNALGSYRLADVGGRWTCYFVWNTHGDHDQKMWKVKDNKLYNRGSGNAVDWDNDNGIVMRQKRSAKHKVSFEIVTVPRSKVTVDREIDLIPFALNKTSHEMETSVSKSVTKYTRSTVYRAHYKELRLGFELEVAAEYPVGAGTLNANLKAEVDSSDKWENTDDKTKENTIVWEQKSVTLPPMTGRYLNRVTYIYRLKEGNQTVLAQTTAEVEEQCAIDDRGEIVYNAAGIAVKA